MVTLAALRDRGIPAEGATVAVQGFGQVGAQCARILTQNGLRVVAISDSSGGIHRDGGVDIYAAMHHREPGARLDSFFGGGDHITNAELLELDVDVLVPAAVESQVHSGNASRVRARVIAEGANAPLTPEADRELADRGVVIIPDILANAGGLVVSYFEWVQDLQAYFWGAAEVDTKLEHVITQSYETVREEALRDRVSLRQAAYRIAVAKVARATHVRGIYP